MIDTNEIYDKQFEETNGGYNKKEVDSFLDHICDEIEKDRPKQQIDTTGQESFCVVIGVLLIIVGAVVSYFTTTNYQEFSILLFAQTLIPWIIGGMLCVGISMVLTTLRHIANRIK